MARLPRVVLPGHLHHVTQRGNRRQKVFFSEKDFGHYRQLLAERPRRGEHGTGAEMSILSPLFRLLASTENLRMPDCYRLSVSCDSSIRGTSV